jgi:hypothetical protein
MLRQSPAGAKKMKSLLQQPATIFTSASPGEPKTQVRKGWLQASFTLKATREGTKVRNHSCRVVGWCPIEKLTIAVGPSFAKEPICATLSLAVLRKESKELLALLHESSNVRTTHA